MNDRMPRAPKLKAPETTLVLMEMARRNLNTFALAQECGMNRRHLTNQLANDFKSRRTRLVVENALGMPIWSSLEEFQRRQALAQMFGRDLALMSKMQLLEITRRLRLSHCWEITKRAVLRESIIKFCESNLETVRKIYSVPYTTHEKM